jgi:hypothetical protein
VLKLLFRLTNLLPDEGMSALSVTLDNTEPQLRSVFQGSNSDSLAPSAFQTHTIMIECNQPFSQSPTLRVQFSTLKRGQNIYLIPLPVVLTQFLAPASLGGNDFLSRWDRLNAPGLESVVEVKSSLRCTHMYSLLLFTNIQTCA